MSEYLIYLRVVNDGVLCWATDWVEEHYGRLEQNRVDFGGIAPPTYRCHMGREHQMEFHSVRGRAAIFFMISAGAILNFR